MSKPIIEINNISKRYTIGHKESYGSLREEIMQALASPFRRKAGQEDVGHIWALRDVSFTVNEGDVFGIVGRNGAGKSTLLKILSRITEPTTGRITMRGRVASLLEVGTGFHPELTGRENIFLNGALLGMSSAEIKAKFDEIVDFSEIEKFLDTPVKRYSSGMYVRLAFAVAAHLEPEILVIDEVLAVGDASFQKKCLGKMGDVAKGGRTVLFVSHNMAAVENLCTKGVVLAKGKTVHSGTALEAVNYYIDSMLNEGSADMSASEGREGAGAVRISNIAIEDDKDNNVDILPIGSKLKFRIHYKSEKKVKNPRIIIGLYNLMQEGVARLDTNVSGSLPEVLPASGTIICSTDAMNVMPGRYFINIAFSSNNDMQDYITHAKFFDFVEVDFFGSGRFFDVNAQRNAKVLVRHQWRIDGGENS